MINRSATNQLQLNWMPDFDSKTQSMFEGGRERLNRANHRVSFVKGKWLAHFAKLGSNTRSGCSCRNFVQKKLSVSDVYISELHYCDTIVEHDAEGTTKWNPSNSAVARGHHVERFGISNFSRRLPLYICCQTCFVWLILKTLYPPSLLPSVGKCHIARGPGVAGVWCVWLCSK